MLALAQKHLAKDPLFAPILQSTELSEIQNADIDITNSLIKAIISQQLSTKAAATIYQRFLHLFDGVSLSPKVLLETDSEVLKSVGLSKQKSNYIKEIALFATQNDVSLIFLSKKNDEELINYLTQIKGVGRWTVEMLLIFTLVRPDVFPKADLGVQRAMQKLLNTEVEGKELQGLMENHAQKWKPYRSYASRYLWKWRDASKS